ncbi:MAG: DUF4838 domain-containing protein [Armatimonadota bacterium]|nr:DUF4838 domain-containing protein [Armatimonadota bacterium]
MLRPLIWLLWVFGLGSLGLAPCAAERVVLARDGRPAATIVTPASAPQQITWAAQQLQRAVALICGVELPIRSDGQKADGAGLYVGTCAPSRVEDLPPAGANPESYAIRARNGSLFFAGRYPTPVAFAVVSFLEHDLGVRWFAPGDLWEYVPRGRRGQLVVNVRSRVKIPDTSPRIWSGHAWTDSWQEWNLRNKTVQGEVVPRRQFQNFLHRVFPPERYAKTHPEYYPMMPDGTRWIPESGSATNWRPCESNPEVLALTVEYARRWFDENPTRDSFSLGMDDISHLCACPNCRAMDPRPDSYEKREFSDRHYKFVNAVAREIKKTHPDRYVGTLIYSIARNLPETVEKLEDNVFGFITETSALWREPGRKEADHQLTRAWRKRCRHLSRYDYYGMGTITPRVYPHTVAEQIRFDKSLGLEGMYLEVYTFLPNTAPMMWMTAKLQWDAKANPDRLLDEFYSKMFGPASRTMKAYFNLLERSGQRMRPGRRGWVHRNLVQQALAMDPEDVDAGFRLLAKARAEAGSDTVRRRIDVVEGGLRYGSYVIYAYALAQQLRAMPVENRPQASEVIRLAARLAELGVERRRFWAEAEKRDDLLGETVRGLGGKGYIVAGQMPTIEAPGWAAAMRALAWLEEHAPDEAEAATAPLQKPGESELGRLVRAWHKVRRVRPRTLLVNGDFEEHGPNLIPPQGDWSSTGAPAGWHTWSRRPDARFRLEGNAGRGGSAAACLSGADSASYLQTVPVKPGETYFCSAWARCEPPAEEPGIALTVRFRTETGAWHPRRELEPTLRMQGVPGWQHLMLLVEVPEGAAQAVVMLSAASQPSGSTAFFDDVGFFKVE